MKKYLLGLISGLIIATIVGVAATIFYNAKDIEFNSKDSNWNVSTVEDALNDIKDNYTPNNVVETKDDQIKNYQNQIKDYQNQIATLNTEKNNLINKYKTFTISLRGDSSSSSMGRGLLRLTQFTSNYKYVTISNLYANENVSKCTYNFWDSNGSQPTTLNTKYLTSRYLEFMINAYSKSTNLAICVVDLTFSND